MGKIIIMDVDGTLVDYLGGVATTTVNAIRRARQNGHRVYLCTGRSKAQVYPDVWKIGFDGMIGGNGSFVENDGTMIMEETLQRSDCCQVVAWLSEHDIPFYVETNQGLYGSNELERQAPELVKAYLRSIGENENLPMSLTDFFPNLVFGVALCRDDANKISYFLTREDLFDQVSQTFSNLKSRTWGPNPARPVAGELARLDLSKARAVDFLLRHLEADLEDTIAFGDGDSDIPLLEHCVVKVAMGNGSEGIKAKADLVTARVDDDGVYKAFKRLGLI